LRNPDEHVYCTKCTRGAELIKSLIDKTEIPELCQLCDPWNPEDSRRFEERPYYEDGRFLQPPIF
jgi:hypothetical protein